MRLPIWLAAIVLATAPTAADAEATLTKSTPAAGATVDGSPAEIRLEFSEPITTKSTVAVAGPAGHVENGKPLFEGNVMRIGLKPMLAGAYHVTWEAQSADGHATHGTFDFTVTPAATPAPSP